MSNTTENVEVCEFCGRPLERYTVTFGGVERPVGWKGCHCEAATAARIAEMKAEQEQQRKAELAALESRWRAAGIPERYIAQWDDRAHGMCDAVQLQGMGFYIDGTQGTGKTRLAASIAKELIARSDAVKFRIAPALMEAMRSRSEENRESTDELAKCKVLVLDDLGKEAPTAYACERLFDIVDERYNAMRPIIVTSNYTRGEIAQKLTEGDVGRSIASRLCEMTRRVHIDGPDRRLGNG